MLQDLSDKEIEKGINLIIGNASELISDADLLYDNSRFARSYTLYQLAIEEIGKARLLIEMIVRRKCDQTVDYKRYNKYFFNHQEKSKSSILFHVLALSAPLDFFNIAYESKKLAKEPANTERLNEMKNSSLYVGLDKGKFRTPKKCITERHALAIRKNAYIRYGMSAAIMMEFFKSIDEIVTQFKNGNFDHLIKPK